MKTYLKTKDYFNTQEEFELLLDEELDMLITHPTPDNLSTYYKSENYISHNDSSKSPIDKIYRLVKKYSLRKKVKLISSLSKNEKTLLDVGAGTGDFLIESLKNDWKIKGVEPNSLARKKALDKGITLHSSLDEIKELQFQVITLWHVLEHLPDLEKQITKLKSLLKPNGYLIIAVPNYKSYDALKYGSHWAAYDVPRHLWHFSKGSISTLFSKQGFILKKSIPMLFDSFYVSLLSEKYKTGSSNFIKAFINGSLSNLKARSSGQYSSLIYVLKKI